MFHYENLTQNSDQKNHLKNKSTFRVLDLALQVAGLLGGLALALLSLGGLLGKGGDVAVAGFDLVVNICQFFRNDLEKTLAKPQSKRRKIFQKTKLACPTLSLSSCTKS